MIMKSTILLVFFLTDSVAVEGFYTKSIRLPVFPAFSPLEEEKLHTKFQNYLQATGYLKPCSEVQGKFFIPAFGSGAFISLGANDVGLESEYELSGSGMSKEDFGFICTLLMRRKEMFRNFVDVKKLEKVIEKIVRRSPPSPGVQADRGNIAASKLLSKDLLDRIMCDGYIVLDTDFKTGKNSSRLLSLRLTSKSGQPDDIRSDSVKFLDEEAAQDCGLEEQHDLLLGIAGYLNEHLSFKPSEFKPLAPATLHDPLTNPQKIQAAQYRQGEFYIAHSDNGLHGDNLRVNHRRYTCILYCNEDYTEGDGGALRIFLGSEGAHLNEDMIYTSLNDHKTVDIEPINGRLLIFDSRLLHSVEKVLQDEYPRQALTVWITRPQDRPLYGDILHDK